MDFTNPILYLIDMVSDNANLIGKTARIILVNWLKLLTWFKNRRAN